jgi:hypothetical protein
MRIMRADTCAHTYIKFVNRFDLPLPLKVLYQHAGIAALGKKRMAVAGFTRAVISAVDADSVDACCAGDEDVVCS